MACHKKRLLLISVTLEREPHTYVMNKSVGKLGSELVRKIGQISGLDCNKLNLVVCIAQSWFNDNLVTDILKLEYNLHRVFFFKVAGHGVTNLIIYVFRIGTSFV